MKRFNTLGRSKIKIAEYNGSIIKGGYYGYKLVNDSKGFSNPA
jgi:hypothetical protein